MKGFRRNSKEFYVTVVDKLVQKQIDTYDANRMLIYRFVVISTGLTLDTQLQYASYQAGMAILDIEYD